MKPTYEELEQRLIESERYGRQTDITIDNLEMKLAQMAAENAGLKKFPDQIVSFIGKLGSSEIGSETKEKIEAAAKKIKTPATDAFLAEVRASALDEFAKAQDERAKKYYEMSPGCSAQDECQFAAGQAWYFAECIRKGVPS